MALLVRNDEQIIVGTTIGLVAGSSFFTFDGTGSPAKPDYRGYKLVIMEYGGTGFLAEGVDYVWDYVTGEFAFLQSGDLFQNGQIYNIHFENPAPQPNPPSPYQLIDWSYFIRDITIPNIDPTNPRNAPMLDRLNSFIQKYEPQCLKKILGYDLSKILLTETSQRMTDLIYGVDYTNSYGHLRHWQGLVQPTPRISLIADYIYFYFQESAAQQTSGVNTNIPKGEASVAVSPGQKMLDAWNFFSHETLDMLYFLRNQNNLTSPAYPEFTDWQFNVTKNLSRPINMFSF